MIPSVVASQIRRGIEEFLLTTFPITTPFFEGCLDRLLSADKAVFQGPFLSLRLPFRPGAGTHAFFPDVVPQGFRPFVHQERAFERLASDPPVSTLVATGTGSGKTECFLYPILDHCRRHREARGIKAIVVYPMNALANDQARRFARAIHVCEALRGHVTAGLYIGGRDREEHAVMGTDHVITSRDVMRDAPPNILLTNYKMLDYLLIRPEDRPLWRFNGPETLRYLVVDELHSFDGAQGTDLACLLRRLKARLRTPKAFVCGVGTSATLGVAGGAGAEHELRHYASTIFGETFPEGCILGEERVGPEEFLRGELVRRFQLPGPETFDLLDPLRHDTRPGWLAQQAGLWLGEALPEALDGPARRRLAHLLRGHWFLRNLLLIASGAPRAVPEVLAELARQLPGVASPSADYLALLLQSFLALASEARVEVEGREQPLVEIRLDVWLRELTRLVCRVESRAADAPPRLAFHDDLRPEERQRSLPIVHCRDCGMTGWGGVLVPGGERLQPSIEAFYGAYFAYAPNVCFLYPGDELLLDEERQLFGRLLCSGCLRLWLGNRGEHCPACAAPAEQVIAVAVPLSWRKSSTGARRGHHDCAWCGGRNTLSIVGSRSASLTSVAISQLFTSTYNEDKKLLAFSDSVQDASHRAGFFGARTFTFSFRTGLQQVVDEQPGPVRLVDLPRLFLDRWRATLSPGDFIATFFPPDLEWWADYEALTSTGRLAADSDLPERLARRLDWEIWSEYTFESRIGRTLEKTSCSAVGLAAGLLQTAVERLLPRLSEEIGSLRGLAAESLRRFLAGFVLYLKNRGGVFHPALVSYLDRRGTNWELNRVGYLPPFGASSRLPVFLSTRPGRAFDALVRASTPAGATWYQDWLVRSLGGGNTALRADAHEIYRLVLDELVASGILFERPASAASRVWGLEPVTFEVTNRVGQLRCRQCSFNVSVPEPEVPAWEGAPCLRYRCPGAFTVSPGREDYYRRLYKSGDVARVFAREHTALLEGATREDIERGFLAQDRPASPNLLSCTPTLEMGVDIGDLSAVALCSMPPKPSNFIQRVGRAGRRDGNAVLLTVAAGRPHDLYFFEEPREMLLGQVDPPGCFLNAAAVLARQFLAFVFDRWVESGITAEAIPARVGPVLDAFDRGGPQNRGFPNNLLAFLAENRAALEQGFLTIFEGDVEDATRQRILDFSRGTDAETPGLETRLIDTLAETAKERRSLRNAIRRLNERIRRAAADPAAAADGADEAEQLQREQQALNDVVKHLNDRPLLELLTDEGLLPNYAFPEAGVQLKSILYRRIERAIPGGPRYETRTYLYQRPAEAAIAELAPAASFYAEGRRLVIDQINVDLSREEVWRFCRRCSYMEREPSVEPRKTCPACSDPLWEDEGRKRSLLRMRQVICNQDESRSRSRDESDDREVEFFERSRFVVKRDADITAAYAVDDDAFPFGFDFFRRLTLREINFGRPSADSDPLEAGARTLNAAGFVVCHACGKVKLDDELEHALHCRYRGTAAEKQAEEKALRVFFLYREFSSEGIRILLPVSVFDADLQIESFVAALDLGLRRRFRGDPGHLRGTLYDEPVKDSDVRRRYLVVYDAVPGGTGYLKELMKDEHALLDVLAEARDVLAKCGCQNDPAKDGCYRCLLAYRGRHDRLRTSRRRALALLDKIQERRDKIKPVERLDTLPINGLVESELEQQFVEALRASRPGGAPVQLTPQIVHGRPGWYLQTARRSYLIEPQVELGPEQGVAVPGRADFVIYPARETPGDLPIAVFTDGFEYHADPLAPTQRLGLDTAQRMALLRSGRFRVWSLTWDDVRPPDSSGAVPFEPIGAATWPATRQVLSHLDPANAAPWAGLPRMSAFDLLLERLGPGAERDWSQPARAWLAGFLSTNRRFVSGDQARGLRSHLLSPPGLASWPPPGAADTPFAGAFLVSLVGDALAAAPAFRGLAVAPVERLSSGDLSGVAGVFRLHEDTATNDRENFRRTWRQFLWLLNLLQFTGSMEFVTSAGLRSDAYADLLDIDFLAAEPGVPAATSAEWEKARRYAAPEVQNLLRALETAGVPVPHVGFEWVDSSGRIGATAELAWEAAAVAVLTVADEPAASILTDAGWIVRPAGAATADPESLMRTLRERSG